MPTELTPSTTLSGVAYRQVRKMVLSGEIAPGEKLSLERLAASVGMGTTPLREALSRLAVEGLVVGQGQRGYWAASVSRDEYQEITALRLNLECKAFAQSMQLGDADWEARVVASFHLLSKATRQLNEGGDLTPAQWEQHNRAFHSTLIDACGNAWMLRFTGILFDQSERYRHLSVAARAVPLVINESEHEELVRVALARDVRKGEELLHAHIESSARAAVDAIFAGGSATPSRRTKVKS